MSTIGKAILICILMLHVTSCSTVYTEKQTEALSRVVYATKDSLDAARIDLADNYSAEATRMVKPPKKRIEIKTIYEGPSAVVNAGTINSKQRIVVIPPKYKNDKVVVVSSAEYQNLLKDKEVYEQFKQDHEVLVKAKEEVDAELSKQAEYRDQMIKDLNSMQKTIAEKDLALLKCRSIIVGLLLAIIGAGYLKIKGIL
jgi:hypothetical protein